MYLVALFRYRHPHIPANWGIFDGIGNQVFDNPVYELFICENKYGFIRGVGM
jgi:hypothetical protein